MNPRTTGILFLVAAAMGAFVYFYEIRGGEKRQEAEEQAKRIFPEVEEEALEAVELTTSDGKAARLERRDDAWRLVAPVDFPADAFAADGIASALTDLKSEKKLEDPQPPAVYGLDEDALEVRFTENGEQHALRVGDKAPVGSATYVSTSGSDAIYTVPTFSVNALRKSLDDLREKRILSFDTASVQRLSARWPGGGVALERDGEDWRLVEPLDGPADRRTVDDLLSDLSFLRADGFVDDPPPDAEAGLEPPDFRVELTLGAAPAEEGSEEGEEPPAAQEPRRLALAIGQRREGEHRLVRAGERALYRIPSERLAELPRRVVEYRFRSLAEFSFVDAERLEIVLREGGEELRIEATHGEDGWSSEPEQMEAHRISSLVSELSRLRARDILAESAGPDELRGLGLSPPRVELRAWAAADAEAEEGSEAEAGEGGAPRLLAEVHLGVLREEGAVVAQAAGNETVFELGGDVAERIPVSLEAFRNRFASASVGAPADALEEGAEESGEALAEPALEEELEEEF